MKKLLYLFITILTLSSCSSSSDDPSEAGSVDSRLVGKWQLSRINSNGEDIATDCQKMSTIEFRDNKTFSIELYDSESPCEIITSESSDWTHLEDNEYVLRLNGELEYYYIAINPNEFNYLEDDGSSWSWVKM